MPAYVNCRIEVPPFVERCHSCGAVYVPCTWRAPLQAVAPRREAWGLPSKVVSSAYFRVLALLTPIWVSLFAAMLLDGDAYALS